MNKIEGQFFNNNQELFDAAWKWLITDDNPQCINSHTRECYYRKVKDDKVMTCIIGSFIPDSIMTSINLQIRDLILNSNDIGNWFKNVDVKLLVNLQLIHDEFYSNKKNEMINLAKKYLLTYPNE